MRSDLIDVLDASAYAPEAPLDSVADGYFLDMAWPLLIASADHEQYEDFIRENGLLSVETRRFIGHHKNFTGKIYQDPGKILLLLPGWEESPRTKQLVEWWDRNDRYSVALDGPLTRKRQKERETLLWFAVITFAILTASLLLAVSPAP